MFPRAGLDDLQRKVVLDFLEKDGLVANQIVFQASLSAHVGHVGDGDEQADMLEVAVVKPSRIDDQLSRFLVRPLQVDLIGIDARTAVDGRRQQGLEPGHGPFPVPEFAEALAGDGGWVDLECPAEGCARCDDPEISRQKQ
mgnify:CR=1 FL=1